MNKSRSQSGSIVAYAIAAVVLLALLAGAFYWAKHRAQTSTGEPANTPAQEAGKQSSSNKPDQAASDKSNHQDESGQSTELPSDRTGTTSTGHNGGASQSAANSGSPETSGHIAPAGPTDVIQTVAGLSVLTGAAVAYQRSRRRQTKA